jgi:glycosyltransferase involved in cell wall biosynthesis
VLLAAYRIYRERAEDPLELVLAGSATAVGPGIRTVPFPGGEQLAALYAGAAALVHPALYEGFGLTPLEAMTVGTPVLAARAPGIVEVCADSVRYADPHDPVDFAASMVELAQNGELRAELAELGRRRAAEFSWGACALAHVDAYSLALS